ncbi:hypothetical protein ACFVTT_04350 [Streptomyces niveus]
MAHTTADDRVLHSGGRLTSSPRLAVRVALRTLSPALNSEALEEAWQWLSEDHHDALQALVQGEPITLTLRQGSTMIQWTARPVQFLKLTTRQGINLPACAQEYTKARHQRE